MGKVALCYEAGGNATLQNLSGGSAISSKDTCVDLLTQFSRSLPLRSSSNNIESSYCSVVFNAKFDKQTKCHTWKGGWKNYGKSTQCSTCNAMVKRKKEGNPCELKWSDFQAILKKAQCISIVCYILCEKWEIRTATTK